MLDRLQATQRRDHQPQIPTPTAKPVGPRTFAGKMARRVRDEIRHQWGIVLRNRLVKEWVIPVTQPVVWIWQPPRSGGTMLMRLLDGHPQLHVHPRSIGFAEGWPADPATSLPVLREAYSLAPYVRHGSWKRASNLPQRKIPIYFDERWFNTILSDNQDRAPRGIFNALHTAFFNAWRNNQNFYGEKRFVVLHSAPRPDRFLGLSLAAFRAAYPDGRIVFVARNPADWLASVMGLRRSRPFQTVEQAIAAYRTMYDRLSNTPREQVTVLEFDRLVTEPRRSLEALCGVLELPYHPALDATTTNGIPLSQNSSHEIAQTFAPDPKVIGHGRSLRCEFNTLPAFPEAQHLYERAATCAINH